MNIQIDITKKEQRSFNTVLDKNAFRVVREMQNAISGIRPAISSIEQYRSFIQPILQSIKTINATYSHIFEQMRAFDSLHIKEIISGLQTDTVIMNTLSSWTFAEVTSTLDNLSKANFLSDIFSDDFSVEDAEQSYENGEITQTDINDEVTEILSKKQFSPKATWNKLKKSKYFLAAQIVLFIIFFFLKPVTEYIADKARDALGITEFWEETGVYELLDSMFGKMHDITISESQAKITVDENKTGNLSKQRREQLVSKINAIRAHIAAAPQDKNTAQLLEYIAEIEKEIKGKKYGLVFEKHRESIDEVLENNLPVLSEDESLFIDGGGQMNFLIEGDNLASLKLLEKTHTGKIDVIYIDPPYNTGAKNWKYNNDYVDENDLFRHSKWLSMMHSRLLYAKKLLTDKGVLICAIDENESATLRLLLDDIFGNGYEYDCITIVHNPRGIQGKNFSYTNEFAYFVVPKGDRIIGERLLSEDEISLSPLRNWGGESLRTDAKNCFYPIIVKDDKIIGFGDVSPDDYHPQKNVAFDDGSVAVYPIDAQGVERKWRYARQSVEKIREYLTAKKTKGIYDIELGKIYGTYKTTWSNPKYDANNYGKQLLNSILPNCSFDFPKSLWNVYDCLYAVVGKKKDSTILDFFAGSGTTGHAVMKLNAEDGGARKFILCTNNENNICREVTYERIKRVIEKEGYAASLKYFKVDFLPISDALYYEYADELLRHVRELVELENGINFTGNAEIAIVLTEEELDAFALNIPEKCKTVYLGHDILPTEAQERILKEKGITVNIIPDYYYRDLET